jgi:hypothetical protein
VKWARYYLFRVLQELKRLGLHGADGSGGLRTSAVDCGASVRSGHRIVKNGALGVGRQLMAQRRNGPRCFAKREDEEQHACSSKGGGPQGRHGAERVLMKWARYYLFRDLHKPCNNHSHA